MRAITPQPRMSPSMVAQSSISVMEGEPLRETPSGLASRPPMFFSPVMFSGLMHRVRTLFRIGAEPSPVSKLWPGPSFRFAIGHPPL